MDFLVKWKDCFRVKNHEGAEAYSMSPAMELYTAVVTSSLSDMTYERADERIERIASLVEQCPATFVAQLAVYTRTEMHLRSVPLLLAVELARVHSGDSLVSRTIDRIVLRVDEIMRLLEWYHARNSVAIDGKPAKRMARLSKQVQKGLQMAFNRFSEYQFAKYDCRSHEVKLRDALFLVHPKADYPAQQAIFDKIARDDLETPYTWETELSALGQPGFATAGRRKRAFARKWAELIFSGKVGYMALLRNMRSILTYDVGFEARQAMMERIAQPEAVHAARQLPFRYLAAYREVYSTQSLGTAAALQALEDAAMHAASHITGFDHHTRVLVAADVSGSMYRPVSKKSKLMLYDVGLMLAAMLKSRCKTVISGMFGDTFATFDAPTGRILSSVMDMRRLEGTVGYSTNGYKVIDYLLQRRIVMDKVMMFTDCQLWDSTSAGRSLQDAWRDYKQQIAPKAKLYIFDLAGYGHALYKMTQVDVYLMAGWSDKVFDVLEALDRGEEYLSMVSKIEV